MTSPPKKRANFPKHVCTYEVIEAALLVPELMAQRMHSWLDALHSLREQLREDREQDRAVGRAVRSAGGKHKYLTKGEQYKAISAKVASSPALGTVHSQVLQNVADQVERGTKAWLKGTRGALRAIPRKKYRSFTFTQYGFAAKIRSGRLHLSRLGEARLLGLRRLPGRVKNVTLTFKQGRWFAQFTCEVQVQHSVQTSRNASAEVSHLPDTGLDTGLARVATLADGTVFLPGKPLKQVLPRLKKEQQRMSRQFEARNKMFSRYKADFKAQRLQGPLPIRDHTLLSGRLQRQIRRVAILHTKITCSRRDQLRKLSRQIEQQYRLIAVEEHSIEFMKKNRRTSRAVSDVAPGMFKGLLKHALGEERYVAVPNRRAGIGGNSQTCLCGASVPKSLKDRWHRCSQCGLSADRDQVSACIAMGIAFGDSNLGEVKPPEPGQGIVRRGESKCQAGKLVTVLKPVTLRSKPASTELPVNRLSSIDRRLVRKTTGAQATVVVNNPPLLSGANAPNLSG